MSAIHHYKLVCDVVGCQETINLGLPRADMTRAAAAKNGWTHVVIPRSAGGPASSSDHCPTHSESAVAPQ